VLFAFLLAVTQPDHFPDVLIVVVAEEEEEMVQAANMVCGMMRFVLGTIAHATHLIQLSSKRRTQCIEFETERAVAEPVPVSRRALGKPSPNLVVRARVVLDRLPHSGHALFQQADRVDELQLLKESIEFRRWALLNVTLESVLIETDVVCEHDDSIRLCESSAER
jgi:hypothetical protein